MKTNTKASNNFLSKGKGKRQGERQGKGKGKRQGKGKGKAREKGKGKRQGKKAREYDANAFEKEYRIIFYIYLYII